MRTFRTFSGDLHRLADWLTEVGITTIAMESTGVYWIPVFEVLEARGFEVLLVNARDVKHVPGRKSDVNDAQWLQQLHQYGLLRGSFRPRDGVVRLRAYLRHRKRLVRSTPPVTRLCQTLGVSRHGFYAAHRAAGMKADAGGCPGRRRDRGDLRREPAVLRQPPGPRGAGRAGPPRQPQAGGAADAPARPGRPPPASVSGDDGGSHHPFPVAPNVLARQCATVAAPDTIWVTDITYFPTGEGWLCLAVILDLCTRGVVDRAFAPPVLTPAVAARTSPNTPPPSPPPHASPPLAHGAAAPTVRPTSTDAPALNPAP